MRKNIFIISALILLSSCSNKSEEFCNCLKTTEKLNIETSKVLEDGPSEKSKAELKRLRSLKMDACKKFETMGKPQLLKLQEECEK